MNEVKAGIVYAVSNHRKNSLVQTNQLNKCWVRHLQIEDLKLQLAEKIKRINSLEDNEVMLQEQVRTFREDFESERRDREQAQSRIAALESELAITKQQVIMPYCQPMLLQTSVTSVHKCFPFILYQTARPIRT